MQDFGVPTLSGKTATAGLSSESPVPTHRPGSFSSTDAEIHTSDADIKEFSGGKWPMRSPIRTKSGPVHRRDTGSLSPLSLAQRKDSGEEAFDQLSALFSPAASGVSAQDISRRIQNKTLTMSARRTDASSSSRRH